MQPEQRFDLDNIKEKNFHKSFFISFPNLDDNYVPEKLSLKDKILKNIKNVFYTLLGIFSGLLLLTLFFTLGIAFIILFFILLIFGKFLFKGFTSHHRKNQTWYRIE